VQSERLDEEEQGIEMTTTRNKRKHKTPKKQKTKKKKNADQKENPVVGGYFSVLITSGSIQRVLNSLFVRRCEENLLLWPMKLLDLGV
jgi:hypothetical protein